MAKPVVKNYDKLPKWAQDEITSLKRDLEHITKRVQDGIVMPNADWKNVWLPSPQLGGHSDEWQRTGFYHAQFVLKDPAQDKVGRHFVQCRTESNDYNGTFLRIMAGDGISIRPESSNSARIYIER